MCAECRSRDCTHRSWSSTHERQLSATSGNGGERRIGDGTARAHVDAGNCRRSQQRSASGADRTHRRCLVGSVPRQRR